MHVAAFFCHKALQLQPPTFWTLERVGINGWRRQKPPHDACLAIVVTTTPEEKGQIGMSIYLVNPDGTEHLEQSMLFQVTPMPLHAQNWITMQFTADHEPGAYRYDVRADKKTLFSLHFVVTA